MLRYKIAPLALVLAACASTEKDAVESAPAVPPAAEMQRLAPMIGTWEGTANVISPTPQEAASMGMEGMPSSMKGGGTSRWVLGGQFLQNDSWHEMGEGQIAHYQEIIAWDAKAQKFHTWFFSDHGERGEGWMTVDQDGKTFRVRAEGTDATGAPKSGSGMMTLVSDGEIKWSWTESSSHGMMKLEGTNRKK